MKNFSCGIYFDTRRRKSNGQYPIFLKLYREKKNVYIDSGFTSVKDAFDGERFVGNSELAARYNVELRELFNKFRLWCIDFNDKELSNETVKICAQRFMSEYIVKREYEDKTHISLSQCWDEYVNTCVHTEGTEAIYNKNWKLIKEYDSTVALRDVSVMWLRGFENWMIKRGLRVNSRGQVLRNIKTIINYAITCDYTQHYPFKVFKIKVEETEMRALSREEIKTLLNYTDLNERQRWARDMWMLSFYLFGINPVDLANLKKIVHGRIQYRRGKTHQLFDIAVPPEAMEIIEKYKGKDYLLDMHDRNKDYRVTAGYINKWLRSIGENRIKNRGTSGEALFPNLTLYWARYSAASLMAELDIPMETISRCLGHSSGLKVTQIYVKFNQKKIDEAQRKMIDALK